jgi:2-C-methyl-D-erythritol 2,4-cyclodiphosphate synthase
VSLRIGQGWDLHRLVPGRELWLGGLCIPSALGEDGHSDGDVLLHAITDAILGAAALGDIGGHFPPFLERGTFQAVRTEGPRPARRRGLSHSQPRCDHSP